MGAMKIVKALEEQVYIKNITRKVQKSIQACHICQMVKHNNEKKEGVMIPITSKYKLEKVFLDICGPFPRSGGCLLYTSFCKKNKIPEVIQYEDDDPELWQSKLEEIREFQREKTYGQINKIQAENLIQIYNKYKHVFSNAPGKVKGYQCVINFKEPVNFRRKSYPIAYSIKNEVRNEINRMIQDDIIEYSQSPYTVMCERLPPREIQDIINFPNNPPKDPIEKNTYPMLVLPLRKIFVPRLVEIGPVV